MHQKLTEHGKSCMQNIQLSTQLPTKTHDELKDNFNNNNLFLPLVMHAQR